MYLKKLEIKGFKSFADKTDVEFKDGITCIVGPNGSGKSNITDSVRWVLGEQKAKLLRGSKMEDVIFNGTGKRKPVGLAEVSLIFDNKDKSLAIDYDEVKVTRRVHRSGDNDYLINDSRCRLKDVRELFMDTSIGTEGYSIIGQGRIDSVLSQNDEDRRHIFEEASGTAKFRTRKKESERKLEATELNLMRINDIVGEIEERYPALKKDAEKAELFLKWESELKGLEIRVLLESLRKSEAKHEVAKLRIEEINLALKKLENDHNVSEAEYKSISEELEAIRLTQDELSREIGRKSELIKEKEGETALYVHKLDSLEETKIENENFLKSSIALKENLVEGLKELEGELEEFQKEYENRQDELNKIVVNKENCEENIRIASEKASKKQSSLNEKNTELEKARVKIVSEDQGIQGLEERLSTVESRINKYKESSDDSFTESELLEDSLNEALGKKEALDNKLKEENEKIADFEIKIRNIQSEQRERDSILHKNEAEMDMLSSLEASHEGYDYAVRAISEYVAAQSRENSIRQAYRGIVADLLEVPTKYVTAIEAVLGRQLQNIITSDESAAQILIERLKTVRGGRATFLPVSTIKSQSRFEISQKALNINGVIGLASDLVGTEKEYENILSYLLGKTVIVEDFATGMKLLKVQEGGYRIVTVEGEVINSSGAITGGYLGKKKSGILARKGRMVELESGNRLLKDEIASLKERTRNINREISDIERKKSEISINLISLDSEIKSLQNEKLRKDESVKHIKMSMDALNRDREMLKEEVISLKNSKAETEKFISDISVQIDELKEESEDSINKLKAAQESLSKWIEDITELKIELASSYEKLGSKRMSIERQNEKLRELEEREKSAEKILENLESDKSVYIESKKGLENEALKLLDDKMKMEESFEERKIELSSLESKIKELYDNRGLIDEALNEHRAAVYKQEVVIARINAEVENIHGSIFEKYEIGVEEAKEYVNDLNDVNLTAGEQSGRVKELRESIRSLGTVNVNAPNEFAELNERRDFLVEQRSDLEEGKKSLEGILRGLEREMKKKFLEVFDEINVNFKEVFSRLFMGGTAGIELNDPSNALESSIEIHAQPPGKKLQSLSLLSGGERSLTAIALIFAIMKIKPAPFCILDEIDAALDDVNVKRFAGFIEEYAEKSQFIVITHRKGTMESADILYGVTMEEMGISRLLSLKLEQAQRIKLS